MKDVKLGKIRTQYKGKIFSIKERDVSLPDGKKTIFEYCERPPSVSTLALNKKGELLMVREYRYGSKKNMWFLPGGRMDKKGDTPRSAAQRELREETGYRARRLKLLHKKSPSNTLFWDIYIYAAKDLVHDPLPQEIGEFTEPHFVPLKKAVNMALSGEIENEFISYNIIRFNYMLKSKQFRW